MYGSLSCALKCLKHTFKNSSVPSIRGKDICPALPAPTSRQLVLGNLVRAVGKGVT